MQEARKFTFPIIGDDEALHKDTRVLFTNEQLLTRNPSVQSDGSSVNSAAAPKAKTTVAAKKASQFAPYKAKVSYSTQHRPLNSDHSGVSSFDKMPKRTQVDEAKARAIRAAATLPKPVKQYVSPLDRPKEDPATRRTNHATLTKRPLGANNNPLADMKRSGMNVSQAAAGMRPAVPHNKQANSQTAQGQKYFEDKRKNIFDRGIV